MEAWKEAELLERIRQAVRDAFPPALAQALAETLGRWYAWSSRNDPAPAFPEESRCRMCARLLPSFYANLHAPPPPRALWRVLLGGYEPPFKETRFGICRPCLATLSRLADDPEWPLRDMAQAYALRAMNEDPAAASFLQRVAGLYPDFRLQEPPCALCDGKGKVFGADHARLCVRCIARFAESAP